MKPTNPKAVVGSSKIPVHLWPSTATLTGALGLLDGALKYGRTNWRSAGVRASIYIDAILRHTLAYLEGCDTDPESGLPHLAGVLASAAILVDAKAAGVLTDDRMYPGGYVTLLQELTPHVTRLKRLHADKHPKHFTIADEQLRGVGTGERRRPGTQDRRRPRTRSDRVPAVKLSRRRSSAA